MTKAEERILKTQATEIIDNYCKTKTRLTNEQVVNKYYAIQAVKSVLQQPSIDWEKLEEKYRDWEGSQCYVKYGYPNPMKCFAWFKKQIEEQGK